MVQSEEVRAMSRLSGTQIRLVFLALACRALKPSQVRRTIAHVPFIAPGLQGLHIQANATDWYRPAVDPCGRPDFGAIGTSHPDYGPSENAS